MNKESLNSASRENSRSDGIVILTLENSNIPY